MKNYVKPTVDVVELSVRENMANLPDGVSGVSQSLNLGGAYGEVMTTVYDLTATSISNLA